MLTTTSKEFEGLKVNDFTEFAFKNKESLLIWKLWIFIEDKTKLFYKF